MLPQLLSNAEGSELMAPIAATLIFGLSFSTLITLVLVPVMYYIFDAFGAKVTGFFSKRERQLEEGTLYESK